MLISPGQSTCLKNIPRTNTMQGLTLTAITATEIHTSFSTLLKPITFLHSERQKLYRVLAIVSVKRVIVDRQTDSEI